MSLIKLVYQDTIIINGIEYKGSRNIKTGEINIPYTEELDIGINDIIKVILGKRENQYKVIDCKFIKKGTLNIGTKHPNLLTLIVKDISENNDIAPSFIYNIASINGEQIQIGNNNIQNIDMTSKEIIDKNLNIDDKKDKSSLIKEISNNSTVASIIGAGVSALFK